MSYPIVLPIPTELSDPLNRREPRFSPHYPFFRSFVRRLQATACPSALISRSSPNLVRRIVYITVDALSCCRCASAWTTAGPTAHNLNCKRQARISPRYFTPLHLSASHAAPHSLGYRVRPQVRPGSGYTILLGDLGRAAANISAWHVRSICFAMGTSRARMGRGIQVVRTRL